MFSGIQPFLCSDTLFSIWNFLGNQSLPLPAAALPLGKSTQRILSTFAFAWLYFMRGPDCTATEATETLGSAAYDGNPALKFTEHLRRWRASTQLKSLEWQVAKRNVDGLPELPLARWEDSERVVKKTCKSTV